MVTRAKPRTQSPLPRIAPEDFRKVAIQLLSEQVGADGAARTYQEAISQAPQALAASLRDLQARLPRIDFDFTERSLHDLDHALARHRGAGTAELVDGVGAYLGETLRIAVRGNWVVRFDPTPGTGLRASTLHLDPGVAGHPGYESDVFQVAERAVLSHGKELKLARHFAFAKQLMARQIPDPEHWNGLGCRLALIRRG